MAMRIIVMISMMQIMLWGGAGDLDSTFGSDGNVTTDLQGWDDYANSIAIQSDGKIILAGESDYDNKDFALVRYDINGSLDNTFGSGGKVTTPIGNANDRANSVAIQSDKKIVMAGDSYNGSNYDFAVVRYDINGSLDSTFGVDGKVTTTIGSGHDYGYSVAIQSDDKIVVAGHSYNGSNYDFALVRYDTNGSLDSTFGVDGKVTTAIGSGTDYAYSVAIQSDDKIVVAGHSYNGSRHDFAVVRYDTNGSLDNTFGVEGIVTTAVSSGHDYGYSVAIQSDDKIIVAGSSSYNGFAVVRYNTNGSLDSTFGVDGKVTTPIGGNTDKAYSVAIQSDGKIVVAGFSATDASYYDFAVVRYDADGVLDSTFGVDGKVTTAIGNTYGYGGAKSIAIQSDGKIVVAGVSSNGINDDFAVVRYIGSSITLAPIYYLLQ